jgi:integrase
MWREDEIAAFLMHYVVGDAAHTAFALALCTGAAVSDLVFLGWQNVEGAHIRYRRSKTGNVVRLPILPELAEVLAALPRDRMTFLQTVNGTRRSSKSITGDMNRWVRAAGIGAKDHAGHMLSLHGLRKALGRRLADAGCSPHEVMAVLGHKSISSAEVYTRQNDRERAADSAAGKWRTFRRPKPRFCR